ncbi:MAG: TlpA disulfide reductase family protein [Flavobacteriaceae bacterium]
MRLLISAIFLFSLLGCQENGKDTIQFTGKIAGAADDSKIYFQKVDENNQPYDVDTIAVKDEAFSLEMDKLEYPEVGLLNFRNLNTTVIFFQQDEDINAVFDLGNLYESTFEGGKENDLFLSFKNEILEYDRKKKENMEALNEARKNMENADVVQLQTEGAVIANEEKVYKKEFIEKNINSVIAMMLLNEMISKRELKKDEVETLMSQRDESIPENVFTRLVRTNLDMLSTAEVGNTAPDFSGPTPEGDQLSLKDAMGKVTLIDFWASWCRPCRVENPNVVRVHNQYKDQGFNIISVSLDRPGQREKWINAIKDDKMDWHHVSNLQFWNDPIARKYGIRSIPATYILDENGVIVAKNVRGEALGQKVGELIQKQKNESL